MHWVCGTWGVTSSNPIARPIASGRVRLRCMSCPPRRDVQLGVCPSWGGRDVHRQQTQRGPASAEPLCTGRVALSSGCAPPAVTCGLVYVSPGVGEAYTPEGYAAERVPLVASQPPPGRVARLPTTIARDPSTGDAAYTRGTFHVREQFVKSAVPGGGISAELARLASLKADGILTDEEFAAAKARLLGI